MSAPPKNKNAAKPRHKHRSRRVTFCLTYEEAKKIDLDRGDKSLSRYIRERLGLRRVAPPD